MAGERDSIQDLLRKLSLRGMTAADADGDQTDATDNAAGGGIVVSLSGSTASEVIITDGTDDALITGNGSLQTTVIDSGGHELNITAAGQAPVVVTDGTDTIAITAAGLLTTLVSDGTDTMLVNTNGSINTVMTDGTDTVAIDASGRLTTIVTDGTDTIAITSAGLLTTLVSDGVDTLAISSGGAALTLDAQGQNFTTMQSAASTTGNGNSLGGVGTTPGAIFVISNSADLTSGTLVFEASTDGTNWFLITVYKVSDTTRAFVNSIDFSSADWNSATFLGYHTDIPALSYRARISVAIVGGTITVTGRTPHA